MLCDVNADAVENAKGNVEKHNLSARVEVLQSDVFSGLGGKFLMRFFGHCHLVIFRLRILLMLSTYRPLIQDTKPSRSISQRVKDT